MSIQTLGRYRILEELEPTGQGRLLLALDPQTDERLRLRTLEPDPRLSDADRSRLREGFLAEARALAAASDPAVPGVRDAGEADGTLFLAQEASEAPTLERELRTGPGLRTDEAVELVARAAERLDALHRMGLTHGDLRPANLTRVGGSGVRIDGFAVANPIASVTNRPGCWAPSPAYLAPEQVRGEAAEVASDQFSLAAVLFELLAGGPPFPGDTESSVLYRIVHEAARDAETIPAGVAAVLRRAMAKAPADRFASMSELAAALRDACVTDSVEATLGGGGAPAEAVAATQATIPPLEAPSARPARRGSALPFVVGLLLLVLAAFGYRALQSRGSNGGEEVDRGRSAAAGATAASRLETRVRTEPPGAGVLLDGIPLDPSAGGLVRFRADGPKGVLTAVQGCRTAEHRLDAADHGGEVVLVLDPVELAWRVDPGLSGVQIRLNGEDAGKTPRSVTLDLCRDNELELRAEGYRSSPIRIASGATPLEARKQLFDLQIEQIPRGHIVIPGSSVQLVYYVDGERQPQGIREVEVEEGEHELRFKNEYHWIDERRTLRVAGGERVELDLGSFDLATLVVQAFPANCKVALREPGGAWRELGETPASRRVTAGRYEVRVQHNPTGKTRIQEIRLRPGDNPPVRVSFAGDA